MPEATLSLSQLWAVATTAALGSVLVHLLLRRADEKHDRHGRRQHQARTKEHHPTRQPESPEPSNDGDSDDTNDMPPPPQPSTARRPARKKKAAASDGGNIDDALLFSGGRWGFSMEEARQHAEHMAVIHRARSSQEVLEDLQKGNARFWTGTATRPEISAFERRALIKQQFPSVAVLGCSDSRVPVEIVFDQGLGDMFVIRVAGNCLDTTTSASLQYAVVHLKVKVVVVMGHEGCGAIKAAMRPKEEIEQEPHQLSHMLSSIKSNLDEERLSWAQDVRARDREAVVTNVKSQVIELAKDPKIIDLVNKQELLVVGAFYEISSGIVDFFYEVSNIGLPSLVDDAPEEVSEGWEIANSGGSGTPSGTPIPPSRGIQSRFDPTTYEVTKESSTPSLNPRQPPVNPRQLRKSKSLT